MTLNCNPKVDCVFSAKTDDLGCWPLDGSQTSQLGSSHSTLVELLDVDDDLIDALISANFSSLRQLQWIRGREYPCERAEKLLDMVLRRSQDNLRSLIECVRTNQKHLVQFFTGDHSDYG
jgi:hypothetical protein